MSAVAAAIGGAAVLGIGGAIISSNAAGNAAQMQSNAANYGSNLQYSTFQQQMANEQPWLQAGQSALYGPNGLMTPVGTVSSSGSGQPNQSTRSNFFGGNPNSNPTLGSAGQNAVPGSSQTQYQINPALTQTFTQQDFTNNMDPAYQFDLQQGSQALQRSAAAQGSLMSGGTLKDLTSYAQGQASNEYQNAYSRFMNNQNTQFNRLASIAGIGQTATGQINQAGMNMANNVGNIAMGNANAQGAASIAQGNTWSGALSGIGQGAGNAALGYSLMNRPNPYLQPQQQPAGYPESTGGYQMNPGNQEALSNLMGQ